MSQCRPWSLAPHLGAGLTAHLATDSPAAGPYPSETNAVPAAGAPPVLVRVAAGRGVVVIDGVLAPATAYRYEPERACAGTEWLPLGLACLASSF